MINYKLYYTIGPFFYTSINTLLTIINLNWDENKNSTIILFYILSQIITTLSISEIFFNSLLVFFVKKSINSTTNNNSSTIINYNLKAYSKDDIDLCFLNMYDAYINNLSSNSIAVLISITENKTLQNYEKEKLSYYRNKINKYILENVDLFLKNKNDNLFFGEKIYSKNQLTHFCNKKVNNFILIYRDTNVLKKCGQYQDLICLSEGYKEPYTYLDFSLYGAQIRIPDKMFTFIHQNDFYNIYNKKFTYTLVLDCDTIVPKNFVNNITNIAQANQYYTIFQPKIELANIKTFFQNIQKIWLEHSNYNYAYVTKFLNHSGFFGKGLINNKKYLEECIGYPDKLIEYVPTNALSHDTFESMCMPVIFLPNCTLYEDPPKTYLSWNFRELRWNTGELIVLNYLIPDFIKKRFRWSKRLSFHRQNYKLSFNKLFFALSSIRLILMWPFLLLNIILSLKLSFYNYYFSYIFISVTSIIIPNLIKKIFYKKNILLYSLTSIYHVLPEPIIGTTRLIISTYNLLFRNLIWHPSNHIEKFILKNGRITVSFGFFGLFSLSASIIFYFNYKLNILFSIFLTSIILLPFYNIFTGFNKFDNYTRVRLRKIKIDK